MGFTTASVAKHRRAAAVLGLVLATAAWHAMVLRQWRVSANVEHGLEANTAAALIVRQLQAPAARDTVTPAARDTVTPAALDTVTPAALDTATPDPAVTTPSPNVVDGASNAARALAAPIAIERPRAAPRAQRQRAIKPPAEPTTAAQANPPPAEAEHEAWRELPQYAAKLAPPQTLRYQVLRGPAAAVGTLSWQVDGEHYTATLATAADASPQVHWASHGVVAAHGIAPERMVTQRRGRDVAAVNFQRAAEKITFSGPKTEQALAPSSQDRLTWLIQLAAIVNAQPQRFEPGQSIAMHVAVLRGEADVWQFEVVGPEAVALPQGPVPALKLRRRAQRLYDLNIEIWLDPAQHHLPLRWQWQAHGSSQPATQWLRAAP